MTPTRIALVHSFYGSNQPSGENDVVDAEASALSRAGFEVQLFDARTDDLETQSMYRLRAALRVATGRGASPLRSLRDFDPEIVHVHNLFPNFGRNWVEDIRVPLVHTLHNYRPLCASGTLFRSGCVCTLCPDGDRWAGVRYRCYRESRLATAPIAWANRNGPTADPVLRRATRLIVLSSRQARQYERAGLPMERVVLSPNFLPETLATDNHASGEPAVKEPGFVFAGRLAPEKGILRLLECWPKDQRLTIIGDGPQRDQIHHLARQDNVQVLGRLSRGETVATIRAATGLVWPSHWHETFGLVYIEALSVGTPVLAFVGTPVAETVLEDDTGALTEWEPGTISQAANGLRRDRAVLSQRCGQVFDRRYTEEAYVRRISSLYQEVLSERAG